jgi:hypothetical protein
MAKIDIHIDTETSDTHGQSKTVQPLVPAHKVGLLSTIPITDDQINAFLYGFGSNSHAKRDNLGYAPGDIRQGKKDLKKLDKCDVIAVTGGRAAFDAIKGENDNPTFVCLIGEIPDPADLGNCAGGISLNTWESNKDRFSYLTGLGYNPNQIGLYYNPNSGVAAHEVQDWDNNINPQIAGVSSAKPFSGGTGMATPNPVNNPAGFAADFAPGGLFQNLTAVIISADPFFQANKDQLIQAVNDWLAVDPANRYVCYPLQDYQNPSGTRPRPNRSTCYGPDLGAAYNVLGFLAKSAIEGSGAGFFMAANVITEVV